MKILTKSKQLIKSVAITGGVVALVAAPGTAFAHGGGSGDDNGRQRSSGRSSQSQQASQQKSNQPNKQAHNSSRWDKWQRDKEARHKTCEERQTDLNNRAAAAKDKYTKQLNGLNIVYSGIQTYSATVTIQDYDALKAEADASQANTTNVVGAITAPQLNCDGTEDQSQADTDSGNASNTLNQQIKVAKDALSDYRHDVFKLFNAAVNS